MIAPALHFAANRRPCREEDFLVHAIDRGAPRRLVHLQCEVVRTRDFERIGSRTVDLSARGMQVMAEDDAEQGEEVQVLFRLPFDPRWIFVEGTITRVIAGLRPGDWGPAFGVHFGQLADGMEDELRDRLYRFPPSPAWRPRRIDYAASVRLIADS